MLFTNHAQYCNAITCFIAIVSKALMFSGGKIMEFIHNIVASINDYVWGPYMLVLILGVGLILFGY